MAVKFGIFGCGMIGKMYADRIRALGHEVVSACDVDLARAFALKPTGGAYKTHGELLTARGSMSYASVARRPITIAPFLTRQRLASTYSWRSRWGSISAKLWK